jgi:hypothetical protein
VYARHRLQHPPSPADPPHDKCPRAPLLAPPPPAPAAAARCIAQAPLPLSPPLLPRTTTRLPSPAPLASPRTPPPLLDGARAASRRARNGSMSRPGGDSDTDSDEVVQVPVRPVLCVRAVAQSGLRVCDGVCARQQCECARQQCTCMRQQCTCARKQFTCARNQRTYACPSDSVPRCAQGPAAAPRSEGGAASRRSGSECCTAGMLLVC